MKIKHKNNSVKNTGWAIALKAESSNGKSFARRDKIVMREAEIILIARDNDIARPYLEMRSKSKSKTAGKEAKEVSDNVRILDKKLLETIFRDKLHDVEDYMNAHSLEPRNLDDLLKICEFYDSITEN